MFDHHNDEWNDEAEAAVRAADDAAIEALRARLDVEGRLTEVLARAEAERAFAAGTREVLASWTLALSPATVRSAGTRRRIVRNVENAEFFTAAVGRRRAGLDPWPDVALVIDQDRAELRVVLSLPDRPPAGTGLVVVAHHGSWRAEGALAPAGEPPADGFWPVDLTCRIALPADEPDVVAGLAVDLLVVRAGD
ncbi:hypothetical protein AB0B83_14295 [Micromonospora sp. NPDC049060]|uniref:hypothetical protein n=1 Tax=unclassified Micromonospora TaxID=2617518 RepID=UPI0033C1DFBD